MEKQSQKQSQQQQQQRIEMQALIQERKQLREQLQELLREQKKLRKKSQKQSVKLSGNTKESTTSGNDGARISAAAGQSTLGVTVHVNGMDPTAHEPVAAIASISNNTANNTEFSDDPLNNNAHKPLTASQITPNDGEIPSHSTDALPGSYTGGIPETADSSLSASDDIHRPIGTSQKPLNDAVAPTSSIIDQDQIDNLV